MLQPPPSAILIDDGGFKGVGWLRIGRGQLIEYGDGLCHLSCDGGCLHCLLAKPVYLVNQLGRIISSGLL